MSEIQPPFLPSAAAPVASMCDSDRPLLVINRVSVTTELIKARGGGPAATVLALIGWGGNV